jgi:4-amino-4-deoxy-L-arabinose transferase-like glycosyltransferase
MKSPQIDATASESLDRWLSPKVLIILALIARVAIVIYGLTVRRSALISSDDYLGIGADWIASNQYPPLSTYFPPFYPILCKWLIQLFGTAAITPLLGIHVIAGVVSVYIIYRIARHVLGRNAAAVAGLFMAVDPLLLIHTPMVLSETIYVCLLLSVLYQLLIPDEMTFRRACFLGVTLAIALLTRSVGVVIWPIVIYFWLQRGWAKDLLCITIGIVFVACLPVAAINKVRYDHLAVSASARYNISALWVGPPKAASENFSYRANLSMWGIGANDLGSSFAQADAALPPALEWTSRHPLLVTKGVCHGVAALFLGPGLAYYEDIVGIWPAGYAVLGSCYRALLLAAAAFGAVIVWRRTRAGGFLIVAVLVVHAVAPGAAGYSRYGVPCEPLEILLAAEVIRLGVKRMIGITNRPLTAVVTDNRQSVIT